MPLPGRTRLRVHTAVPASGCPHTPPWRGMETGLAVVQAARGMGLLRGVSREPSRLLPRPVVWGARQLPCLRPPLSVCRHTLPPVCSLGT